MANPFRLRVTNIAAKTEAAEGTAESLTVTECKYRVEDLRFEPTINSNARPAVTSSLSQYSDVAGSRMATVSFTTRAAGAASLLNLGSNGAEFGLFYKACGLDEDLTASTSAIYDPSTIAAEVPSITIGIYADGLLWTVRGCRGNLETQYEPGANVIHRWSFTGVYNATPTDTAILADTNLLQIVPPVCLGATFTVHSVATLKVSYCTINLGNTLALRSDMNSADGYKSCAITGRNVRGSFVAELEAVGTFTFDNRVTANTLGNLSTVAGATAGNILTTTAAASSLKFTGVRHEDRDGVRVVNVDFQLARTAVGGEDELRFAFT